MKNIYRYLFLPLLFISFISCDDYVEKGIEGQWQLQEIKSADGSITKVDTIFYSFDRNVFQYLKLLTPTNTFMCFGMYEQDGNQLKITVYKKTFEPWDCFDCFDWGDSLRIFTIRDHTSSKLVLDFSDDEYKFRKY